MLAGMDNDANDDENDSDDSDVMKMVCTPTKRNLPTA